MRTASGTIYLVDLTERTISWRSGTNASLPPQPPVRLQRIVTCELGRGGHFVVVREPGKVRDRMTTLVTAIEQIEPDC